MENILKVLNGKQIGNQYCFSHNNEKFIATLDYEGAVDYGWRELIRVKQIENKYSNVFKFKRGGFDVEYRQVKYYDGNKFIIISDFSDIVKEIVEWIDFMTA